MGQAPHLVGDMIFCMALKIYHGMSMRRTMTTIARARDRKLLDQTPGYSSIARYGRDPRLTPILKHIVQQSTLPLAEVETSFAIDSSGFSTRHYDRWVNDRNGRRRKRAKYIKAHLTCGVKTKVVVAADVSDYRGADAPYLLPHLRTAMQNFDVRHLSADAAYLADRHFQEAEKLGVSLYIPFKSNSTPEGSRGERSDAWRRAYHFYMYHRSEFKKFYHQRSVGESMIWMTKASGGPSVRAKTKAGQYNEILLKILVHNLCVLVKSMYELGIEPQFRPLAEGPRSSDEDDGLGICPWPRSPNQDNLDGVEAPAGNGGGLDFFGHR